MRQPKILSLALEQDVPVVEIGEVCPSSEGLTNVTNGSVEPLTTQSRPMYALAVFDPPR